MWYGVLGALILLSVFTVLMLVQLYRGASPDCHCFGQLYSQAVGPKSVIKNLLMMIPAIVLLIATPAVSLEVLYQWLESSVDLADQSMYFTFGIAIITLLFVIVFYLKRYTDEQQILNRHLEEMNFSGSGAAGHRHHEHMTAPDEGLPIGAPAPDFELPDMNGKAVLLEQLLTGGLPMLFFFVSPTCVPCKALLPEIGQWQEELGGKIDFIFISSGLAEENTARLPGLGGRAHLLQKKREVAELFKAKWTPTVLLVNAAGVIASRPAAGDIAIRDLITQIRENDLNSLDHVENGRGMSPNELKIGEEIPEFELPEVKGDTVSDNALRGKKTLVLFWGLDCPHCQRMLPELKEWEDSANGEAQIVIFSSGDEEQYRAMNLKSPILMDEGNKVGNKLGMFGTPSAVMIDESGKIVSETAVGAEQIWALIGKRK
jgi:thiol-disulfide isomerase/thioredoxin